MTYFAILSPEVILNIVKKVRDVVGILSVVNKSEAMLMLINRKLYDYMVNINFKFFDQMLRYVLILDYDYSDFHEWSLSYDNDNEHYLVYQFPKGLNMLDIHILSVITGHVKRSSLVLSCEIMSRFYLKERHSDLHSVCPEYKHIEYDVKQMLANLKGERVEEGYYPAMNAMDTLFSFIYPNYEIKDSYNNLTHIKENINHPDVLKLIFNKKKCRGTFTVDIF